MGWDARDEGQLQLPRGKIDIRGVGRNGFSPVFGRVRDNNCQSFVLTGSGSTSPLPGPPPNFICCALSDQGVGRDAYRAEVLISALFVNPFGYIGVLMGSKVEYISQGVGKTFLT